MYSIFQTIIETMEDGVGIVDENENFSFVNPAAELLFETNTEGLVGHNLSEFMTSKWFSFIKNQTLLRRKGESSIYTIEIITPKANTKTIQVTAIPKFKNHSFTGTFGIFKDISEKINNETFLFKADQKYKLLIETMNEGLLMVDTNANIIFVNPKFLEILKLPEKELIGQNISHYVCPESLPLIMAEFEKRKKGLKGNYEAKLCYGNTKITIQVASSPVFDENGLFTGSVALITDLTERKNIELALQKSEAKFRKIMEILPDIVSIIGKEGQLIYNSPAATRIHGYNCDELAGLKTMEMVHPEDLTEFNNTFKTLLGQHAGLASKEYRYKNKDGSYTWMEALATNYLNDPTLEGIISVSRDISERKLVEERMSLMVDKLREANLMKDRFFSIIAHDLINPFNSLLGLSNLLSRNAEKYDQEKIKQFSEMIHESAKQGFKFLENLLDWSRTQTNRFEFEPTVYFTGELIEDSIEIIESQLQTKEIEIIKIFDPEIKVFTDKNIVSTILRNLLSNAIKFSHFGSKIEIHSATNDDFCIISIVDFGVGIFEHQLPNLFQLDSSYSTPGTGNEKGTGLGLILCKEFIEKQGGKIWLKSKINEGSQFNFTIPLWKKTSTENTQCL